MRASTPCPRHGRPCPPQEMPWPLCASGSKLLATPLQSTAIFIFLGRGQVPLVQPPLAPMSPTSKCLDHLCPSSPIMVGAPLKSAHVFIFQKGLGQVPLAPPTGAHVPHQEMPWPLVPLWFKTPGYATAVNSACF